MTSPREPLTAHLLEAVRRTNESIHSDTADLTDAVRSGSAPSSRRTGCRRVESGGPRCRPRSGPTCSGGSGCTGQSGSRKLQGRVPQKWPRPSLPPVHSTRQRLARSWREIGEAAGHGESWARRVAGGHE